MFTYKVINVQVYSFLQLNKFQFFLLKNQSARTRCERINTQSETETFNVNRPATEQPDQQQPDPTAVHMRPGRVRMKSGYSTRSRALFWMHIKILQFILSTPLGSLAEKLTVKDTILINSFIEK